MGFTRFEKDVSVHQSLGDEPNADNGLSSEELKKKWDKLPLDVQNKILEYIPQYIESQPDKKFRKNPQTFLNQKSWEDELILPAQVYKTNQITYADF
jgi:hypothetical protein